LQDKHGHFLHSSISSCWQSRDGLELILQQEQVIILIAIFREAFLFGTLNEIVTHNTQSSAIS
jgi:hypothetical protein